MQIKKYTITIHAKQMSYTHMEPFTCLQDTVSNIGPNLVRVINISPICILNKLNTHSQPVSQITPNKILSKRTKATVQFKIVAHVYEQTYKRKTYVQTKNLFKKINLHHDYMCPKHLQNTVSYTE